MQPKEFTDEVSVSFKELAKFMNFEYDDFIRTTEERHKKAVIALWNRLEERGQIYLDSYSGWYSVLDEAFYQESELIDGKAPTGAEVQWIKEESYFFAYQTGKTNYLSYMKVNQILSFLRAEKMKWYRL